MLAGPHSASPSDLQDRLAADRTRAPYVLLRDDQGVQRIHSLADAGERLTIGRSPRCDIAVSWDTGVSRVHAALERLGGEWALTDDGLSLNGSFVNGERVRGRRLLADRDTVELADTRLVYRDPTKCGVMSTVRLHAVSPLSALPDAQRRVLVALARPLGEQRPFAGPATNQEIASELFLSVDTVKSHLRGLFRRFGVDHLPRHVKRPALVEQAFAAGAVTALDFRGH